MILRYQVESVAKRTLEAVLKTNASAKEYLLHPARFTKWIDLLHVRCNDLQWAIQSRASLVDFIQKATIEYGRRQLDKAELKYDAGEENRAAT